MFLVAFAQGFNVNESTQKIFTDAPFQNTVIFVMMICFTVWIILEKRDKKIQLKVIESYKEIVDGFKTTIDNLNSQFNQIMKEFSDMTTSNNRTQDTYKGISDKFNDLISKFNTLDERINNKADSNFDNIIEEVRKIRDDIFEINKYIQLESEKEKQDKKDK